jgi:heterodisulfide reductase subunit A-like polyferredoxin
MHHTIAYGLPAYSILYSMGTVVVVGAGVSGLQAARALLKKGYRVTVLEQSQDIGGVWSRNYTGAGRNLVVLACVVGEGLDVELTHHWLWNVQVMASKVGNFGVEWPTGGHRPLDVSTCPPVDPADECSWLLAMN